MLKGLLNSAEMEDRLAAAQQARGEKLHPGNLRLMIPSPNVDLSLQLERPPSRQRNLPMHLNADSRGDIPNRNQGTLEFRLEAPNPNLAPALPLTHTRERGLWQR